MNLIQEHDTYFIDNNFRNVFLCVSKVSEFMVSVIDTILAAQTPGTAVFIEAHNS